MGPTKEQQNTSERDRMRPNARQIYFSIDLPIVSLVLLKRLRPKLRLYTKILHNNIAALPTSLIVFCGIRPCVVLHLCFVAL